MNSMYKYLLTLTCLLIGTSLFAQGRGDTIRVNIYDTITVIERRTVQRPNLSRSDAPLGAMFIHKGEATLGISMADIDSVVFYRSSDQTIPPIFVITRVDTVFYFRDTMRYNPSLRVINGRWLTSLGIASFATDSIWTISSGRITQVWSDAVRTDVCSNKTQFNGGVLENGAWTFNIDCRSNPGFPGDLFSWQAVYDLRYELCPYPWRVPTLQDFMDLDLALDGRGARQRGNTQRENRGSTPEFVKDAFVNRWGGTLSGVARPDGTLFHQGVWGDFWSISERCENIGFDLSFGALGTVGPQHFGNKADGLSLRCIRK